MQKLTTFTILPLILAANAYATDWHHDLFIAFRPKGENRYLAEADAQKGDYSARFFWGQQCYQPESAVRLNRVIGLRPCGGQDDMSLRLFRDGHYRAEIDLRSGMPTLKVSVDAVNSTSETAYRCPSWDGNAVVINVGRSFQEGEIIRDFYSGRTARVYNGQVRFQPAPEADGLLLLERVKEAEPIEPHFEWKNATVYFVMTDRFYNGNPDNDRSYGRKPDGMQEIATFHGGDLIGLQQKLDYLQQLGVNVLWITSPLEQIHGWVGGGDKGDFPHYAYHGYYHQDWTALDANMGNETDLRRLVEEAHKRGIRILFDVVMNHTGYATLADMQQYQFGSLYLKGDEIAQTLGKNWTDWQPKQGQNWHSFNDYINFSDKQGWQNWWGKAWIRSDIGDYDRPRFDDLRMSLASLPDIKTESDQVSGLPHFYRHKSDTLAVEKAGAVPRDYLIDWLTRWVRDYGIDGFRVDTAKHVEQSTWLQLKTAAVGALREWKKQHPQSAVDNADFWMVGEAWGHRVIKSDYFQHGFDAMLNFDLQDQAKNSLECFADIAPTYQEMSKTLSDFNMLSYISSHDTRLFLHSDAQNDLAKQKTAAALLLLTPGAVQIYYGDESGRAFGVTGSDPAQGTRSDMNWQQLAQSAVHRHLLEHWQKLARFRQRHPAIGAGIQTELSRERYYAFERRWGEDKVIVVWAGKRE
ncbi:alpha-amylase [Chelonobacter oris]|uniref:Alpha-amylase n=1 Tax=Chelonobacter oris TaxID=505317 RepID=A0A0A3ALN6_9PAST|nr:alpha-amylase [Chelonobacter oris]KGQ70313.1 alpha-amylase [Chelonobacter oris]